jgi:hypothetical protein
LNEKDVAYSGPAQSLIVLAGGSTIRSWSQAFRAITSSRTPEDLCSVVSLGRTGAEWLDDGIPTCDLVALYCATLCRHIGNAEHSEQDEFNKTRQAFRLQQHS